MTYRFRGHSMSDPAKYRTKEELEKAKERDPIVVYEHRPERARLDRRGRARGAARQDQGGRLRSRIAFAEASRAEPPIEALYDDIIVGPSSFPQE